MLTHDELIAAIPTALDQVELDGFGAKSSGKVRDIYQQNGQRFLITTDRVSAFDRVLGTIPYKGQVLNELSAWWFEQTRDLVPNHLLGVPDPNVTIARAALPLPVEVVVRGYITGVTSTSLWTLYEQGERQPYGVSLPDGLKKNDPLPQPIITPTTKAEKGAHDEQITPAEIVARGLVDAALWQQVEQAALAVFARGQHIAAQAGLILVDTKYEFGLIDGQLALIDELHTPDSSRYWLKSAYAQGKYDHLDKEFLRQWFVMAGYKGEGAPPKMPNDFIALVAMRYMNAYERLTGRLFAPASQPAAARIQRALTNYHREF
jgi:phosphoribosylaminoimidazole-succinocarboxamide synthase